MKVEIYTTVGNVEYIVPFFLKHYKRCFPGAIINVAAANSTDNSIKLCQEAGCNISYLHGFIPIKTEKILTNFKNNCWKNSEADWIIVCDIDELCQITEKDLAELQEYDVIRFQGYNMFDEDNVKDPEFMTWGAPSLPYSKACLFRKSIKEINYQDGSHICKPSPPARVQEFKYKLLHYKQCFFTYEKFCKHHSNTKKEHLKKIWDHFRINLTKVL